MLRFNPFPTQSVELLTDYFFKYLDAHETQSYWIGKGAERLGLQGRVQKKDFRRLAHNVHPHSLERLTPATKNNRRIVQDFTVSPRIWARTFSSSSANPLARCTCSGSSFANGSTAIERVSVVSGSARPPAFRSG